jgi:hypothetical protein
MSGHAFLHHDLPALKNKFSFVISNEIRRMEASLFALALLVHVIPDNRSSFFWFDFDFQI